MPGETAIQPISSAAEEAARRPPESPIIAARREADAIEAETHWSRLSLPVKIVLALSAASIFVAPRIIDAVKGRGGVRSAELAFNQAIVEADARLQSRIVELDQKVTAFSHNPDALPQATAALDVASGQITDSRRALDGLRGPSTPAAQRFREAARALLEADIMIIQGYYPEVIALLKDTSGDPAAREAKLRDLVAKMNELEQTKRAAMLQAQRDFAFEAGITLR